MPQDLRSVAFLDLVREIERRTFASLIAVKLKETSPDADLRVLMHAEPKQELHLLGLATLAHADVVAGATRVLLGPPVHEQKWG